MNFLTKALAAALIAGGASSLAGSADAVPLGGASLTLRDASTPALQTVQWRRGWGRLGVGLAAGAIIGGAIAASTYGYGYGYPAYGYGYGPAYGNGYGYAPAYGYAPTSPAYGYGYGYAPSYYYNYGYGPAYYGYSNAYPRYRAGSYVRRAWRRW